MEVSPGITRVEGRGVSPGSGAAPVACMPVPQAEPARLTLAETGEDLQTARRRLASAIDLVDDELRQRVDQARGESREVLDATRAMVSDPTLRRQVDQLLEAGSTPEAAVWRATQAISTVFADHGGLFVQRVRDVEDVRDRVVCALQGRPTPGVPHRQHPFVLVADDLSPADTATLDPRLVVGIVTAGGGPTSHTAILARSLGIPAVVAAPDAGMLRDGMMVLVDGDAGVVYVDPPADQLDSAAQKSPRDTSLAAITADGHRIALLANVSGPQDADSLRDIDGIGLFRTELCFLARTTRPSVDEQAAVYRAVLAPLHGRKVVFRTLDAGADKPMPFLDMPVEPNPALGLRGFRLVDRTEGLLDDQLSAITMAAADADVDLWVMAPMISTPQEARRFVAAARSHGLAKVGVMIEVPSAALCAAEILAECDFVSIGTNDLTQYVMAADREVAGVAHLNEPWQPAVLRLLQTVADAGVLVAKPVGVCGEAAADPLLACVLIGMGVDSLSMSWRSIPAVARRLSTVSLDDCRAMAAAALVADSADAARVAATDALGE